MASGEQLEEKGVDVVNVRGSAGPPAPPEEQKDGREPNTVPTTEGSQPPANEQGRVESLEQWRDRMRNDEEWKNPSPPQKVLLGLVPMNEQTVREERSQYGNLPIHIAAYWQAPTEVSLKLLELYPESAREKTNNGWLPIHHAARYQVPAEVVLKLLEVYPESVGEKLEDGYLPIHIAAQHKAPAKVSLKLLELYPESSREKNNKGRLPIHHAARYQAPTEVSLKLLELYPESAREKNNYG